LLEARCSRAEHDGESSHVAVGGELGAGGLEGGHGATVLGEPVAHEPVPVAIGEEE
jgi:hypothetical protein